jgi:hypothetical protein
LPAHLIHRFRPDSILEFRAAAQERYRDGLAARAAGRRTGAIYLFGYTAEMVLKAGYFHLIGFGQVNAISLKDLKAASDKASQLNFKWQGNLHDLVSWATLIIATRASVPNLCYSDPAFPIELDSRVRRIALSWREVLRYHKNVAYEHEVARVERAATWLLGHVVNL